MIKVDNLVKKYKDFELNLSMEIPKGAIVGLIGKNGSGKSTTIKAILGLINPTAGKVTVMGEDSTKLSCKCKENIGVALADACFSGYIKVSDTAAIMKRMYKDFDQDEFLRDCNAAGLPADKLIKDFSTGMKAKLRVLIALSHNAKLLILDEPTAGLDVGARNEILELLREYMAKDEERTILITSHIATDLESLCDDIYLIDCGKVILHQDISTIMDEYAVIKVDNETYEKLDKEYIIKTQNETFGKVCLTSQKQYYKENYPGIVVENSGIDDLILIMTGDK